MSEKNKYHNNYFVFKAERETLWLTLNRSFFSKFIHPESVALDLGAGYCHFINNIFCRRRIAVDAWPGFVEFAGQDVEAHIGVAWELGFLGDASVDFVLASNLLEHLSKKDAVQCFAEIHRVLKPEGNLLLLQPNYTYSKKHYFDDPTHVSIYTDASLQDLLLANGFNVVEKHPKFMPLTIRSKLPVWPWLVRLYLWLPFKPFAGQMLLRAKIRR